MVPPATWTPPAGRDRLPGGRRPGRSHRPILLAAAAALLALPAAAEAPAFKVLVRDPGVYRVDYQELAAAGLDVAGGGPLDSSLLALTNRGRPVPLWVDDGGDGRFGPGDHLEFVGEHLAGETTFYDDYSDLNVYRLSVTGGGARMSAPAATAKPTVGEPAILRVREHLEEDRLLLRFPPGRDGVEPELWYWAKLTHLDRKPFRLTLDLGSREPDARNPLTLRVRLRGWSHPPRRIEGAPADHRVEVLVNGVPVGAGEWNGQDAYVVEVPQVPEAALDGGHETLEIRVPRRRRAAGGDELIDVVLVDWIEVAYRRRPALGAAQERIDVDPAAAGRPVELWPAAGEEVTVYGAGGSRIPPPDRGHGKAAGEGTRQRFALPAGEEVLYAVPPGGLFHPAGVVADPPSHLRDPSRQADYLIIAHPTLLGAIAPLAEFHRQGGLSVEVVSVEDVYDEFHDGIVDPRAIRDFIDYAYHHYRPPAPRYVLLVGDASWDPKHAEARDENYADWTYRPGERVNFWKNASTPYSPAAGHDRNLVPTGHYGYLEGHAASDNYFVSVDGDDFLPDLAIGRFPVTEPAEVAAIVDKTIRYATSSALGPWRRRILWVTSEEKIWKFRSDRLAAELDGRGFADVKVYPSPDEESNFRHQAHIQQALDEGQLLVHFLGHGGRYIWRTGPSDLKANADLFTLDHLDALAPSDRLPVVISLTCYSAPFDHPSADSIGEKFLRIPGRGAVAVVAASWRNSPAAGLDRVMMEEFTQPGTIGDAFLRAKRRLKNRSWVEMYNLLGDPAVPLALPGLSAAVTAAPAAAGGDSVAVDVPAADFTGRALVEWVDAAGGVLASSEEAVAASRFAVAAPPAAAGARWVRVYAWNPATGVDAAGGLELPAGEAAAAAAATGGRGGGR
jgi:Peptidase family C25